MSFRQIYLLVSLLAVAAVISACGGANREQVQNAQMAAGIVGGRLAVEAQDAGYWSVAQLDVGGVCTGVLISEKLILTAAHCVNDLSSSRIGFAFFPQADSQKIRIKKMLIHPGFAESDDYDENFNSIGTNENDLAVLLLARPVETPLMAVSLLKSGASIVNSVRVRTYGFGRKSQGDEDEPELRFVDKTGAVNLSEGFLEFPRSNSGTCKGDSGGPSFLVAKNEVQLAAITSYRFGFNKYASDKCKSVTRSMWIPAHLAWIRQAMRTLGE